MFFCFLIEKQNEQEWCKVAYWELSQRVGRLFPVETKSVNVFWNVPLGTGLSLAALTQHHFTPTQSPPESVLRNRIKIGQGIKFNRVQDLTKLFFVFIVLITYDIYRSSFEP